MIRIPTHRVPTHPGEMLLEEFLKPMGLTQKELVDSILFCWAARPYNGHNPYKRRTP